MNAATRRRLWLGALAAALLLGALAAWRPAAPRGAAGLVGYAVCHQIPARSFTLAGRPLPLCARCTGTYLGVMLGFGMLAARRRARCSRLPPLPILIVLGLFFVAWGADGLNSYLTLFPGLPHLYEPRNALRLTTGMLNGLMLSNLVYPVFGATVWAEPRPQRSIENWRELGVLLALAGGLIGLVWWGWSPALYLLALVSALGPLSILGIANALIVLVLMRRERAARAWRNLALPLLIAAALTLGEIAALDVGRAWLTRTFGLSF